MRKLITIYRFGIFVFIVLLSSSISSRGQDYRVQLIQEREITHSLARWNMSSDFSKYKKIAFNAGKYLEDRYKNQIHDYTPILQEILNENDIVLLPNCSMYINHNGLKLKSNHVILFQEDSILKLIPNSEERYSLIYIDNVKNVKIFNANLFGDKLNHLSTKGQWGFGICVRASENVEIYSPFIKQTWGDGIYIGRLNKVSSSHIYIKNAVIDEVRRNGISITSGSFIEIIDCLISNTNGHSPESGVDVEPNWPYDEAHNITFKNLRTFNNKWAGILLVYEMFKGQSRVNTSVDIINHKDHLSKNALAIHGFRNNVYTRNLFGNIKVVNSNYDNSRIYLYKTFMSHLNLEISDSKTLERFNKLKKDN